MRIGGPDVAPLEVLISQGDEELKKYLTVIALLALAGLAVPMEAQSQAIGFKLGSTWSKVDVDEPDADDGIDYMSAFGGGGFIRFGLAGLGLQVDVLALTKGAEVVDAADGDVNFKLDYVDVPVQLVFGLGSSRFAPYVLVGPSFGFEVGCEVDDESTPNDTEIDCDDADFFERKSLDIGATGALGLQIPLGPGNVLVEGRYTHGLSNIADNGDTEIKNRSFGVFAGYSIGLK